MEKGNVDVLRFIQISKKPTNCVAIIGNVRCYIKITFNFKALAHPFNNFYIKGHQVFIFLIKKFFSNSENIL